MSISANCVQIFYSMKHRRGGQFASPRQLHKAYYPCPGCRNHQHPRREILFERYVGSERKTYVMYWRSHVAEYKELLRSIKQ